MKIASVKGFHDILPGESARWASLEQSAREVFRRYHYREIRIPIAERTELFRRSLGDTTDIVEKEMYTFTDLDGTSLSLRPEGTAGVVRAYVEHSWWLREPIAKLFYIGPMFRRERPQKGRLRQFHQIGAEALGREDPVMDAEVLTLVHDLLSAFGLRAFSLLLNSLGDHHCRPAYRDTLRAYGEQHAGELCENCRRRLQRNPLRLLDCKLPACRHIMAEAPVLLDSLCEGCRDHFARVRRLLDQVGVPYHIEPRMVRGLDYYVRTAFEVTAAGLGAQNAVGGGGRYDGLVAELGGPEMPGVGFALGVERLFLAMGAAQEQREETPDLLLLPLDAEAELRALELARRWRQEGLRVDLGSSERSLKSQMRAAGKQGVRVVAIIGEAERAANAATVRDMVGKRDLPRALPFHWNADAVRLFLADLETAEPALPAG